MGKRSKKQCRNKREKYSENRLQILASEKLKIPTCEILAGGLFSKEMTLQLQEVISNSLVDSSEIGDLGDDPIIIKEITQIEETAG